MQYPTTRFDRVSDQQTLEQAVTENITNVGESEFEEQVLQSELPVLVDYWAEWCGPCKMIAPIVEEIAGENEGKLKVVKVDIDQNQSIAQQYNIRGIPTLMIFRDGKVQGMKVGAITKGQLRSFVEEAI